MIAVLSLLLVATMFITAARVATIALVGTGMATESAAFQARSALMGVGFTTREAEAVAEQKEVVAELQSLEIDRSPPDN